MNKSVKMLVAAFALAAVVSVSIISCDPKKETSENTTDTDTVKVDSALVIQSDTTVSTELDSTAAK